MGIVTLGAETTSSMLPFLHDSVLRTTTFRKIADQSDVMRDEEKFASSCMTSYWNVTSRVLVISSQR